MLRQVVRPPEYTSTLIIHYIILHISQRNKSHEQNKFKIITLKVHKL